MKPQIHRRSFLTLLGGAAAAWPLRAGAQQQTMPVIGYLHSSSPEPSAYQVAAFRRGLSETGYVEGRNVAIEFRWANNEFARLPEMAADLVRRRVAVIATPASFPATLAAHAATMTIPVVFATARNPVQAELVASLNRPGGNLTGVTTMGAEVGGKRFGLLHELLPGASRFAMLNGGINESAIRDAQGTGSAMGWQIEVLAASTKGDIDTAFETVIQKRCEALLVNPSPLLTNSRVQIVILAARYAIPAIYTTREFVEVGGLMSYGASVAEQAYQVGLYTGRILKGEKPADLPVMQPTRFEFVINIKTAKTLGLTIPPTLLAIADEVIE